MNRSVGVELGTDLVRAVVTQPWRAAPVLTVELAWDPLRPADAVAQLRQRIGPVRRIALSVGLGFLHLKQASLPPAPMAERRRMLALEPDRFFPVQDQALVVALANQQNFACAVPADLLEPWIAAFEEWAPVECVEPAPVSFAQALAPKGTRGSFALPAGPGEVGLVEVENGQMRAARRVPAAAAGSTGASPASGQSVAPELLCALGAVRGLSGSMDAMLLPDALAARIRRRRLERLVAAVALSVGTFALALWAVDRSRTKTLERVRTEAAALAPRAAPGLELRARLAALDQEAAAGGALAQGRSNAIAVLAALSGRLPAGATVLNLRAQGEEWQIDGSAPDAAAIIPLLDRDSRFEDVRILSASTRYREDDRTYETFSIAFRVRAKG